MKILHTSDWHLGQKFLTKDRLEEHQLALDWMYELIQSEQVEVLLIAGDIFDVGAPPNYARKLYYQFLTRLLNTCCRHIVIVGGNHDSPSMLEAPKDLLEQLNMHVVGAVPEDFHSQIIELKDKKGKLEAVVAAVPFLRDRDLRKSTSAESGLERITVIKQSILKHYQSVGDLVKAKKEYEAVPRIVTGHLYASGANSSAKQDNIYIGDKENIKASQFPDCFDYVALGHIHRPQTIGGLNHVRYSGSIIPLSFSETKDDKSVYILEFKAGALQQVESKILPVFRRLKTIRGDYDTVQKQILAFAERHKKELPPWVEVLVESDQIIPNLSIELNQLVEDQSIELLKIRLLKKTGWQKAKEENQLELEDVEAIDVFRQKCASMGTLPDQMEELEASFRALLNWMEEREIHED
jgi:exonuclease SbcD